MAIDLPLLEELTKDYKRLQNQKRRQGGGVEPRTLMNIAFVDGEHFTDYEGSTLFTEPREENKLYLYFNLIQRAFSKLCGRLGGIDPPFKAQPSKTSAEALNIAKVVDTLILSLDQKLDQASKMGEILYWLGVGGTAFEFTPWIPNMAMEPAPVIDPMSGGLMYTDTLTGGSLSEMDMQMMVESGQRPPESFELLEELQLQGDVGSVIYGPLNVFIDHSARSIQSLAPDQRIYIAEIKTMGWIEENFGMAVEPDQDFSIISSTFRQGSGPSGGRMLQDLIPLVQGSAGKDDPPQAVIVQAFSPPSTKNPKGRYEIFVPGKTLLHSEECPYGEIPITDIHWRPVTTSFWTKDYISDLIAPQRFINKRISQLGEQSNASLYSQIMGGPGITKEMISADKPGFIPNSVSEAGAPLVQRLPPPEIPQWYMQSLDAIMKVFKDIAGGTDLMEDQKFPGQLRGPLAVPMLQEILDTEWGPFYKHLGQRLAQIKQQRLNRVKTFYPPVRTLTYTDRNMKDEVLEFHTEKVLKSGIDFNIRVERGALMPELKSLTEARIRERLQSPLMVLYLDERTGKLDKTKIAQDLQFGDYGREDREAQYRKLQGELTKLIWTGQPIPPVLPFYDHSVMMDELEASMATTEYLRASPPIQQAFAQRWEEHRAFLAMQAQAQQQAMMSQNVQQAVAQATQQAAAMAAARTVDSASAQLTEQDRMGESGETDRLVRAASQGTGTAPPQKRPNAPQRPQNR